MVSDCPFMRGQSCVVRIILEQILYPLSGIKRLVGGWWEVASTLNLYTFLSVPRSVSFIERLDTRGRVC